MRPLPPSAVLPAVLVCVACTDPTSPPIAAAPTRVPAPTIAGPTATLFPVGTLRGWEPVPGGLVFDGDPAVNGGANLLGGASGQFIVRGADARLYYQRWDLDLRGARYEGAWHAFGDEVTSSPAVAEVAGYLRKGPENPGKPRQDEWIPGYVVVAARRTDGALWMVAAADSTWSPWYRLRPPPAPGVFAGTPAVTLVNNRTVYVVARGRDNTLYWSRGEVEVSRGPTGLRDASWTVWQPVPGGPVASDPAVATDDARLVVVVRRPDERVYRNRLALTAYVPSWDGWRVLPPLVSQGKPAAAPLFGGTRALVVAVRGLDGQAWVTSSEDAGTSWSPFQPAGGAVTSAPALWNAGGAYGSVVARGLDGALWHTYSY